MFENHIPKKFCREFVEVKGGSGQLAMVMATVAGIKPCMDDWVKVAEYGRYRKICARYGLFIQPDTIFSMAKGKDAALNVIGGSRLTTTKAFGHSFNKPLTDGLAHVFISRSKKNLEKALKNGWYPLIVGNRVVDKPLVDAFRFGYDLGYPDCCVDFFQKYNNWYRYSYLYESWRNTSDNDYHYLCNPFTKDVSYSYIYHMPCAYNCRATVDLAGRVREVIRQEEPDFARKIDQHLKLPLLVFYERKFYAFKGEIRNDKLYYNDVYFIGQMRENNLFEADLKNGDCVFLEHKDVIILKKKKLTRRIKWQEKSFAPEVPFIIQFN